MAILSLYLTTIQLYNMDSNDDQNSGDEEYDREDDSLSDDDLSSVSSVT